MKTPIKLRPGIKIKSLSGDMPHPDYKGWRKFLETCEIRDEHEGVTYYGTVNCNYILFPDGTLIQNYGYHGRALMYEIRKNGVAATFAKIQEQHREVRATMAHLQSR